MWLQDFLVTRAKSNRFPRNQNRSIRKYRRHQARKFEHLETRHLLAASPITFSSASLVPLNSISVSETTGEKPESKIWQNEGHWWSVMPDNTGTWIWRLD